jgi:hypothetical protein
MRMSSVLGCFVLALVGWQKVAWTQDVMKRLKEFGVESTSFEMPCIVHFDIVIHDEVPSEGVLKVYRMLGRYVRGGEAKVRLDLSYSEASPKPGRREREVFLQHSPTE